MAQFTISIAGHSFGVESLFESTRDYCRNYLTREPEECAVSVSPEDLAFEQRELDEEAAREGIKRRKFTDPFLERAAIQRAVAEHLLGWDTLLLHGSAVAVDGIGYLFMARCGTGKSTHTRMWREVFGDRAVMVNDDKPFVRLAPEGAMVYGAPWSGKHGLDTNVAVPLGGICLLERGAENRIRKITGQEALPMLQQGGCPPRAAAMGEKYEALLSALADMGLFWKMECTPQGEAAILSHSAMCSGGQKEEI